MGIGLFIIFLHSNRYYCYSSFLRHSIQIILLFMLKEKLFFFLKLRLPLFFELHNCFNFIQLSPLLRNHHSKYFKDVLKLYFTFKRKQNHAAESFVKHCRSSQLFYFKHLSTVASYLLFKNSSNNSQTSYRLCKNRQHLPHILVFYHLFCKIFMFKAMIYFLPLRKKNCLPSFEYLRLLNC